MSSELSKNCQANLTFCMSDKLAIALAKVTLNGRSPKSRVGFLGSLSASFTAARNSPPIDVDKNINKHFADSLIL